MQHKLDSATAYCTSAFCMVIGWVVDVQDELTALTVLIGFLIGVIRLSKDTGLTRCIRKLFKK